jgi:hypothetical protein
MQRQSWVGSQRRWGTETGNSQGPRRDAGPILRRLLYQANFIVAKHDGNSKMCLGIHRNAGHINQVEIIPHPESQT